MDFDSFLLNDLNRKKFSNYLRDNNSNDKSADNLLTLYLLISCFKNQSLINDLNRLKQIFDKTYKSCVLKHENELDLFLGNELQSKLSDCLKNGTFDQKLFDQIKRKIRKILENEYLESYLKTININSTQIKKINKQQSPKHSIRSSSSISIQSNQLNKQSNTNLNKTPSSLSLNFIPNPYHVKTKPVLPSKSLETQSLISDGQIITKKNFNNLNSSVNRKQISNIKSKPIKLAETDPKRFFNIVSSKLEKINVTNKNFDEQIDQNLNHISRISTKVSRTVLSDNNQSNIKTTVAYYMPGESLAYISTYNGDNLTLSKFKDLITKRGNFRYFFKTKTDLLDEECVVFQEITDDRVFVPKFNDKVIAKIEYF